MSLLGAATGLGHRGAGGAGSEGPLSRPDLR